MDDPVRLLEVGPAGFGADLLRAGRGDAMSASSRRRILTGIAGAVAASAVATGARAAAKWWLAGGAVAALGAAVIWAASHSTPPVAVQPAAAVARAVVPKAPAVTAPLVPAQALPGVAPAPAEPAVIPARVPARAVAAPPDTSLSAELALIERARGAYLHHDYPESERLLDEHARRFAKPQLRSEATVLRVEVLAARGDRAGAASLARRFLASHPNGPYAQRVRSLLDTTAP